MSLDTLGRIGGGMSTTRMAAVDEQRRAERDAAATRWLTSRGHDDLLPILGLAAPQCEECGSEIAEHNKSRGLCGKRSCATARRAKGGESQ